MTQNFEIARKIVLAALDDVQSDPYQYDSMRDLSGADQSKVVGHVEWLAEFLSLELLKRFSEVES